MFTSVINSSAPTLASILMCTAVAVVLGALLAVIYMFQGSYSKNFILALILLPPLVQCVILMVNGNLGAGIAVAGSFSLVRFRSAQGNAKEICAIFFAMTIGLATGMGYLIFAAIFTVFVGLIFVIISKTRIGETRAEYKELRITIPENLNYTSAFDDLFQKYTKSFELQKAKTTNLGSMFDLTYNILMKNPINEKDFIDEIRCRNGNLTVSCCQITEARDSL